VINATDSDFAGLVSTGPVVVEFGATWCPYCKSYNPIVEQFAKYEGTKVKVVYVDVGVCPLTGQAYGIVGLPTTVYMLDGVVLGSQEGPQTLYILETNAKNLYGL
jgi:thioredoxin 1